MAEIKQIKFRKAMTYISTKKGNRPKKVHFGEFCNDAVSWEKSRKLWE